MKILTGCARPLLAVLPLFASTGAALAERVSYPMDFVDCLKAIRDTASQAGIPMAFSYDTPLLKEFTINSTGGAIVMACNMREGTLTVLTPSGASVQPYVEEGIRRAR